MHKHVSRWLLAAIGLVGLCEPRARAADEASGDAEALVGMLISPIWASRERLTFNYAGAFLREAWPLGLAGRRYRDWSWVGELFAADVVNGFGHTLAGPSLLVRRTFATRTPSRRFYLQAGAGILYSDAYRNPDQGQLGQAVEFKSTVDAGLQSRLGRRWSAAAELMFNHLSDGGISGRNKGVSALGVGLGLARPW